MQVWHGIDEIVSNGSVVTIGNFDGVHRGHRAVLEAAIESARRLGLPAVALTFDPHPAEVHRPGTTPPLLTGLTDRLALLAGTGLDAVLVVDHPVVVADQPPDQFVRSYFVDALRARAVVIGEDARFGRENSGDWRMMTELGKRHGFSVEVVPDVGGESAGRWSSSRARELIETGDVTGAATVLDRPHRMRGIVVRGHARGRELGFPTANLAPEATGTIPADGVYAGWLLRHGGTGPRKPAAISVGTNPTFDDVRVRTVEAHVLGRDDLELYDEEIVVEFVTFLRPNRRFDGIEPLIEQMHVDVQDTAAALGVPAV